MCKDSLQGETSLCLNARIKLDMGDHGEEVAEDLMKFDAKELDSEYKFFSL